MRLAWMDTLTQRRAKTRRLIEELYAKLISMTLKEAMSRGDGATTPSMRIRQIHNTIIGVARHEHCHAAIYRSIGAQSRLAAGGLYKPKTAIVHFEHTIPIAIVLPILWQLVQDRTLRTPRDLLAWVLGYTVAAALDITERKGTANVRLNAQRTINGYESAWHDTHPDLPEGATITDDTKPFLRYVGTELAVFDYRTGQQIDLTNDRIRDHRTRTARIPIYDAAQYFD